MNRVCVLVRSLAHGGAEKQAVLLAHALRKRHAACLVVLDSEPRSTRHTAFLAEHGLEAVFLPSNPALKIGALRSFFVRERIGSLFCFLPSDTVFGSLVARWARVERIHGGLRNSLLPRRKELALRLVHNHVSHLTISNSHAAAERFVARGFARARMRVIPNGIFVRPEPPDRPRNGRLTLLTVGRFVPEKDYRTALEAVRIARDEAAGVELRYRIAGWGPQEDEIRRWTAELGLERSVEIVIDPQDLTPIFDSADVYLSTSRFEGLSNSILEAMNAGLPIVATDVGDNARLVEEGVNGHLARAGDPRAIAARLRALLHAHDARRSFGSASYEIVRHRYSFETFRQAYEDLLSEA